MTLIVHAVVYGNYDELDTLWSTTELAEARAGALNKEGHTLMWRVQRYEVL